ncbi:MAG: topA [Clostridiales bacterium]|jgi:DNA topoisomerase-1|nr:topA [Clostridiales bacterium]
MEGINLKNLVIVESPAKAKTIKKFLGTNFEVRASNGHVIDLPKSQLGIDIDNDYAPKYITIRGKGELLAKLRKEVKKADKVYLATDPDREGEAISWHLMNTLKLDDNKASRITFNEITKNAVKNSIKQPRQIDMDLVDAQQARRVLDRMVGYQISPLLWKKIKKGLSAGRVQSVVLRIIADREEEINSFIPQEYWTLDADILVNDKNTISAKFYGKKDEKIEINNNEQLQMILSELKKSKFSISEVKQGERTKKPPIPFITSTLQQEASKKLNYSTQKTMRIAQQLYEGVDVKGQGTVGLITYLRTDSVRISEEAEESVKKYLTENYPDDIADSPVIKKDNGKKIQDAHEAIRPSDVFITPAMIKDSVSRDQLRLYKLIWERFVASRMKPALYTTASIKIKAGEYIFTSSTSKLVYNGFLSVYNSNDEEKEKTNVVLYDLNKETKVKLVQYNEAQHFTQPPAYYTEASLVKTLEELGIGRPSTYSPTITTILQRRYVTKEDKKIYITELGEIVNGIMKDNFNSIVDANFTANMESLLDMVEDGKIAWKTVIRNFYPDLDEAVKEAESKISEIKIEDEVSDVICDLCGAPMLIKYGPHGKFLGCKNFPECRNTKSYFEEIGVKCPKCAKEIVLKKTKKGRKYFGCENYPECDFSSWQMPTNEKCEKCGNILVIKGTKLVCLDQQCGFSKDKPTDNDIV